METAVGVIGRRGRFEELCAQHGAEALHVAYLLIGERAAAEDLTQEALLRVFGRFADLRRSDAFRTYLLRTVANLAKNEYRRQSRAVPPDQPRPAAVSDDIEARDALVRQLRRLPYRQQVAVVLRYCCDYAETETAEVLATTPKAVRSLVARGLATLREQEEVLR